MSRSFAHYLIPVLAVLCLFPFINAAWALTMGIGAALIIGNPYHEKTSLAAKKLLAYCIIGLGAGMNLADVAQAGLKGMGYTAISIATVMLCGWLLGRWLKADKESSFLITVGTAICGGSAIAAISPVINARNTSISVAMGVVFSLNALALFLFPMIGHVTDLTQHQFGLWSALAIHDTSSVVGAGMLYGPEALETGTTIKLARALWIVPLVLAISFHYQRHVADNQDNNTLLRKPSYPWFILWFLVVAAMVTWIPALASTGHIIERIAKQILVLCLFFIGTNLTRDTFKAIGLRPLLLGVILWILSASVSLFIIKAGWILV